MIEIATSHKVNDSKQIETGLKEALKKVLARPEVGFTKLGEPSSEWEAVKALAASRRPAKKILVLGIGGSSLGTQVIYQSLKKSAQSEIHFLESPDPHTWSQLSNMKGEAWRDKHILIVSKSGNTLETLAWVEKLASHDPEWLQHSQVTVIASPGEGPLQKWAKKANIPCLWIPSNVGGRFSVLTAVGMYPAALLGLNVDHFREGAAWALAHPQLASQLSAECLNGFSQQLWITQLWTYSESLRIFGEWWQQLWGESLAKKLDRAGKAAARVSTPMACVGPRDQHSLVQQLMEGARDKQIFVMRLRELEQGAEKLNASVFPDMPFAQHPFSLGTIVGAEAQAFEKSLTESGISFASVQVESINEKSLGALFMIWQMVIAQLGEFLEIDAFNQPGVESGKKYAAQILRS